MARSARFSCLGLGSALVLACNQGPVATAPDDRTQSAPSRSGDFSASGALVTRGTTHYATVLADPSSNLSLVAGVTYQQLAEVCPTFTGLFTFDPGTFLNVRRPDGSLKVSINGKNVNVVVFRGVFPGDFCAGFFATPPLATGIVNAAFQDNDFFASGNRVDSFHEQLTGQGVYVETGKGVHISARRQGLIAKDGSIRKLETKIRLK
jgi:hypothetical protein